MRSAVLAAVVSVVCVACGPDSDSALALVEEGAFLSQGSQGLANPHSVDLTPGGSIRIVAANITAGRKQSYDTGEGQRILQGLKPDIVLIQEFNYGDNSDATIRGWVDATLGAEYSYYREGAAQIPNGIISRFPILEAGEWKDSNISNRDFAWARIDVPGSRELVAISVHLSAGNGGTRSSQGHSLANYVRKAVSPNDYLVIGGDMNTGGTGTFSNSFGSLVQIAGPHPADPKGNVNTNASRKQRYDWVSPGQGLENLEVPVQIGAQSFPVGFVLDTRTFSPLADIAPAKSSDSGASNMQHMAVTRDFKLN